MHLQLGKKLDTGMIRKPDGGLKLKSKYVEVASELRIGGADFGDYIMMILKNRKFAFCEFCERR